MVTFKDLFHYVYDRNACFHLSIPDEFGNACVHIHKKVWAIRENGSKSAIQKIEIDEFDYTRYTITLFNDNTVEFEEFTNPYGPNMKMPIYSEYFPLDTGITYEHWKDYRGTQFTLLLAAICKQLDEIISKWIEEDTNKTNTSKLCSKICDTTYFDNTNNEYEFTVPTSDVPPPELNAELTFRTVMNALLDIFKSGEQKKKIREYEILSMPHIVKEPLSIYNKIQYTYIFGKSENGTDGDHPSLFYLVFSANMRVDDMNNPQPLDDTDSYQLTMTSSQESYTIPNIDTSLLAWTSSTVLDKEMNEFINWLRIAFMEEINE